MRSGPDPIYQTVWPVFSKKIGVSVAGENSRAGAQRIEVILCFLPGHLQIPYRGLLIGKSHVLGPIFGRQAHRHSAREGGIEESLVEAFGMQIELDFAARLCRTSENRLPELVAALANPALAMRPDGYAADGRTSL